MFFESRRVTQSPVSKESFPVQVPKKAGPTKCQKEKKSGDWAAVQGWKTMHRLGAAYTAVPWNRK